MKYSAVTTAVLAMATSIVVSADTQPVRLITLDPGHFHAALVQKFMYPQVAPEVRIYAPENGWDLQQHLARIQGFNTRAENPTRWDSKVYTGMDFFQKMIGEKAGNVVVLSGNNAQKTEYIERSIMAGMNVLADKPMAIDNANFELLVKAFDQAAKRKVLLYDIMTERFEITSMLQRELQNDASLFGTLEKGTPEKPAVFMESVHHFYKDVAGKPLVRPAWFFDVKQQGEAVPDVGTHLVDLVQWQCFPDQVLNYKKDVKVLQARRWPTALTPEMFKKVTGLDSYPDYFKGQVNAQGALEVYQNGEVTYQLKGVNTKIVALWNYEAPPGAKDTHYAIIRGTSADLEIKQGPEQKYKPTLYIIDKAGASGETLGKRVTSAIKAVAKVHEGVEVKPTANPSVWEVVVPEKYAVGHEAHFASVTENFLKYLEQGSLPKWEVPNMLAKYYTTTEAYRLSHRKK
jgi:predicted dehydrogenase